MLHFSSGISLQRVRKFENMSHIYILEKILIIIIIIYYNYHHDYTLSVKLFLPPQVTSQLFILST